MATQKQREFIARLADERQMTVAQRERLAATMAGSIDFDQASAIIEWLLDRPYREDRPGIDLTGIPEGRYAVAVGGDHVLFKVDAPEAGKWAGFVFVKNGSYYDEDERFGLQKPGQSYHGKHADLLEGIVADPMSAMALYGHVTDTCGRCGKPLEDPESVARGIGPVCYSKLGVAA